MTCNLLPIDQERNERARLYSHGFRFSPTATRLNETVHCAPRSAVSTVYSGLVSRSINHYSQTGFPLRKKIPKSDLKATFLLAVGISPPPERGVCRESISPSFKPSATGKRNFFFYSDGDEYSVYWALLQDDRYSVVEGQF